MNKSSWLAIPVFLAGLALVLAASGAASAAAIVDTMHLPAGSGPMAVAADSQTGMVYVADNLSDKVSVISSETNTVCNTVTVGDGPWSICVSPLYDHVYVTNSNENTVSIIGTATNTVARTMTVETYPASVDVNVSNDVIYVANFGSDNVSVIDGATNTVTETITVGNEPCGVCVDHVTHRVYVANNGSNSVTAIYNPGTIWYPAEGCAGGDLETWVLVQHPTFAPVTVDLTFMTSTGEVPGPRDFRTPARSRRSFKVNDYATDWDFSTRVEATRDVICERAVYGTGRAWAHDSIGYPPWPSLQP